MPKVTFHQPDTTVVSLTVEPGTTAMRAAVQNGVPGIVGECGGQAMCATCHVYVREPYLGSLPPIAEDEEEMLDFAPVPRDHVRSRLACQLVLDDGLEEIEFDVPEGQ
ncbi:(2Fe-2S)-binding protein (plasmid) [Rhodococcus rhodochrous]|uniref:2Fe-2S iron-sulfur cluster-binding protein n=1 Tax=Rhodococcus rhodochrous TaxID=1829 RepID=UPI00132EB8C2|nr:2Fe-2S iron-sulfur cluster-binding protein [Rhodococcus rhodochrous]QHG85492.1 (2Fe-2S)-binding protein [Rhodococcus rhodochrous]